ncbi:aspartate/glutamate racemase family protein [Paraburkholderia sp.]|uniref:aspartate/glutamate racemase family protein n=1 Tax=Paraburkholderia sp. TaxID=1926495 RepID=UPI0039E3B684
MSAIIHVINPNSLRDVTAAIDRAVRAYALPERCRFECVTLDAGPPGIATQRDSDRAAPLVADFVAAHAREADGYIIACFSDPGLFAARELTRHPVLGIGETSVRAAAALGRRVGVIAASASGMERHWRHYRMLGVAECIVGERAIELPVHETGDAARALERLIDTGRALRDIDGADVVVLGCAGMADLREAVESVLGIPVVEPCGGAAAAMIATLAAGSGT